MQDFDVFSVGHSNLPIGRFVAVLRDAEIDAVADVRSTPASRRFPWFNRAALIDRFAGERVDYLNFAESLGGRPNRPELYRDGIADYEAMARRPEFAAGLDRLIATASHSRVCLMCAEREPLDCHRCLLVARALAERGLAVGHILHDGRIEPHEETERRLLALAGADDNLFVTGQRERLAAAYWRRARAVAYRAKASRSGARFVAEKR